MTLDEYQEKAETTAQYPTDSKIDGQYYTLFGLLNECGEIAGVVKKYMRGDFDEKSPNAYEMFQDKLFYELGDTLWYLAMVAHEFNLSLDAIAVYNLEKLADRALRGVIKGNGDER